MKTWALNFGLSTFEAVKLDASTERYSQFAMPRYFVSEWYETESRLYGNPLSSMSFAESNVKSTLPVLCPRISAVTPLPEPMTQVVKRRTPAVKGVLRLR